MPVRRANGRASDANQALEYSPTGDVILRHRNRPRDEQSLLFLTREVVLYTRRVNRKLNLLVRSPTDVNKNNIKSIKSNHNGLRRARSREAQGRLAPRQCKPTKHSCVFSLMLIPFAGEIRERTPKHQLFRRHSRQ